MNSAKHSEIAFFIDFTVRIALIDPKIVHEEQCSAVFINAVKMFW